MSEYDNSNKGHDPEKKDNDLEKLLLQVFGSKENLEKEKKLQKEADGNVPNLKFPKAEKTESFQVKKEAQPQRKKSPQNSNNPKRNTVNKNVKKAPSKNGKKPVNKNGKKPVNRNGNKKVEPKAKNIKNVKRNKPKLRERIAAMPRNKKIAAVLGIIAGIILLLVLLVVGLFFFYTSLFGKWIGDINEGDYSYNSKDYTDDSVTLSPEEVEAQLKKQLEGMANDPMKDKDVMNVLLIGEDLRDTETDDRGNTDAMLMLSLNKKNKTITMTSFMRDAWVNIGNYGMDKLNAAYWRGGPEMLEDTLENYYGVSIDRYVIVNFKSFIEVIDTIGGIKMDVRDDEAEGMKKPMAEQNKLLNKKKGTDYLKKGGTQLQLNGNQALAYARLRYVGNADYERTERQRKVIAEIINECKNLSFTELHTLAVKIFPQVKLDITKSEFASMLLNSFDYLGYDVQQLRIPADGLFSEDVVSKGGYNLSVLMPDFKANSDLLINTIYGDPSSESDDSNSWDSTDSTDVNQTNNN